MLQIINRFLFIYFISHFTQQRELCDLFVSICIAFYNIYTMFIDNSVNNINHLFYNYISDYLYSICFDKIGNVMCFHHFILIFLILNRGVDINNIGAMSITFAQISTPFYILSKYFYKQKHYLSKYFLYCFKISFGLCRIVAFPKIVLIPAFVENYHNGELNSICFVLSVLYLLQCIWFVKILRLKTNS